MYKQFLKKIKEYGTIIIHRHGRPDGDALGSQIGLKEAILATYPYKKVYAVGDINSKLTFIGDVDTIEDSVYNNALVIVLDSSDTNMINDERYKLGRFIIKVDHHISNCNYGDLNIVDTSEISCASLLAKIIFSNNILNTSSTFQIGDGEKVSSLQLKTYCNNYSSYNNPNSSMQKMTTMMRTSPAAPSMAP